MSLFALDAISKFTRSTAERRIKRNDTRNASQGLRLFPKSETSICANHGCAQ